MVTPGPGAQQTELLSRVSQCRASTLIYPRESFPGFATSSSPAVSLSALCGSGSGRARQGQTIPVQKLMVQTVAGRSLLPFPPAAASWGVSCLSPPDGLLSGAVWMLTPIGHVARPLLPLPASSSSTCFGVAYWASDPMSPPWLPVVACFEDGMVTCNRAHQAPYQVLLGSPLHSCRTWPTLCIWRYSNYCIGARIGPILMYMDGAPESRITGRGASTHANIQSG